MLICIIMENSKQYVNFETFLKEFESYQKNTFSCYRIMTSETVAKSNLRTKRQVPEACKYTRCRFVCTHYGEPRLRVTTGVRRFNKSSATGCQSFILLAYDYYERCLVIKDALLLHNHPTTPDTYARELRVKRLDATQKEEVKVMVSLQLNNKELCEVLFSKYGKKFTLKEVRHLKSQLKQRDQDKDVQSL